MKTRIKRFYELFKYNENDGGGGVGFATLAGNGMGNVVAPTVGSSPGSVWGQGSGTIGSGDRAGNLGTYFKPYLKKTKKKKRKSKKINESISEKDPTWRKILNTAIRDEYITDHESLAAYIVSASKKIGEEFDKLGNEEKKVMRDTYYDRFLKLIHKKRKVFND